MKHLKTFESFSIDTDLVEEGFFDKFFKPKFNKNRSILISKELKKVDTNKVKFMQVKGDDKTKEDFSIDGYKKMATDIDNFNGMFGLKGDTALYVPANWKSASGGFKGTGGAGG